MNGFWIFLIVLAICVATVICFYIKEATFPNSWWLERKLDLIDMRLKEIENILAIIRDEKGGKDHE